MAIQRYQDHIQVLVVAILAIREKVTIKNWSQTHPLEKSVTAAV
jgi:hypothetical protein